MFYKLEQGSVILTEARRSFRSFYDTATVEDVLWMDALVLAWVGLTHGITVPRDTIPASDRLTFERACDALERHYVVVRDNVRGSCTFEHLSFRDRSVLAGALFAVAMPND